MSPAAHCPPARSLVFWFGDLNFRIESLDIRFVKYAIDNNILSQLWEKDQVSGPGVLPGVFFGTYQ